MLATDKGVAKWTEWSRQTSTWSSAPSRPFGLDTETDSADDLSYCISILVKLESASVQTRPVQFNSIRGLYNTYTHNRLTALCLGLPRWAGAKRNKLETAAFFSSSWACWFKASMQFCFTTALLMRWPDIPVNCIVFYDQSNFCHPSGSYAIKGKNNNNNNKPTISKTP